MVYGGNEPWREATIPPAEQLRCSIAQENYICGPIRHFPRLSSVMFLAIGHLSKTIKTVAVPEMSLGCCLVSYNSDWSDEYDVSR